MNWTDKKVVRVAILDLYEGFVNQGMRCLREILNQFGDNQNIELEWNEYEVRREKNLPAMDYDIYISSGGPGSPLEIEGTEWEKASFKWIANVERYNNNP